MLPVGTGNGRTPSVKPARVIPALLAPLALLLTPALSVVEASAGPMETRFTMGAAPAHVGSVTVLEAFTRADGYAVSTAISGNVKVTATAPFGSEFTMSSSISSDGKTGSLSSSVTTPDDKAVAGKADQIIALNKKLGRSVITEVMSMGASYEEAMAQFGNMLEPSEVRPTKAQAQATVQAIQSPAAVKAALATAEPPAGAPAIPTAPQAAAGRVYYDTQCKYIYIDGDVHSRSCDVRYLDYRGASGQSEHVRTSCDQVPDHRHEWAIHG